jgi:hypothetical protein
MRNGKWARGAAALIRIIAFLQIHPPAAAAATLSQHGYWAVVADAASDGSPVCAARTPLSNGAELRLSVTGPDITLVASDPAWTLARGGEADVTITVDGEIYEGTAAVAGPTTLAVQSLTPAFLGRFMNGTRMIADFGGVRWDVSLLGSGRATAALADCVASAKRVMAS